MAPNTAPSLLLLGLTLGALPALAQDGAQEVTQFAWPVPARLEVLETTTSSKVERQRHHVRVWRDEGSHELRVQVERSEVLELDGMDLTHPAFAAQAAATPVGTTFPFPAWRIGADGSFLGAVELERSIERWIERQLIRVAPPRREHELAWLREKFLAPEMLAIHLQSMRDMWDAWAGAWTGSSLAAGARREARLPTIVFGTELELPAATEIIGRSGAQLRVRRIVRIEGEPARAALTGFLEHRDLPGAQAPRLTSYAAIRVAEAELDPATLFPTRASLQQRETVALEGRSQRDRVERREWSFRLLPAK